MGGGLHRGCSIPLPVTLVGAEIPVGDGQQGTASFFLRCFPPRCRLSDCFARAEIRRMGTRRRLRTWGWMEKPRSARQRYPFGKIRVSSPGITSCLSSACFPAHRHLSLTQRPVKTQSVEIRTQKLCESSASFILRQPVWVRGADPAPFLLLPSPLFQGSRCCLRPWDCPAFGCRGAGPLLPSEPGLAGVTETGLGTGIPAGFLILC